MCGADRLVCFLSAFDLLGVDAWSGREEFAAEALGNVGTSLLLGGRGYVCRVGAHVCDETGFTFGAQRDAFIQLLSDLHCALGGEPEFAGCLLLERARDEGGSRPSRLRFGLDAGHSVASRLEQRNKPLGLCFVGDLKFLLLAREALEAGAERGRNLGLLELCVDGPEFLSRERLDLTLTLDDETDRN